MTHFRSANKTELNSLCYLKVFSDYQDSDANKLTCIMCVRKGHNVSLQTCKS